MQFKPKSEKEIAEENLVPAGVYPFEVLKAESKQSSNGNDMIKLELRVFLPDGRERVVFDYLLEKLAYKLFHFCAYTGLSTQYEQGTLRDTDCIGKTGYAKIGIQADKKGEYPDRNSVQDYVRPEIKKAGVTARNEPTPEQAANLLPPGGPDEDVPF